MNKSIAWRFAVIIIVLLGWGFSLFPLTDQDFYEVFRKELKKDADISKWDALLAKAKEIQATPAARAAVSPSKAVLEAAKELRLNLRDLVAIHNQPNASNQTVVNYIRRRAAGKLRLGLDLRGGTEFVIAFDEAELAQSAADKEPSEAQGEIIEILRNRVDQSGVVEAEIKPVGAATISLKIPSIDADDVHEYRKIIEATAKLDFRLVHENNESIVAEEGKPTFVPPANYERMQLESSDDVSQPAQTLYVQKTTEKVSGRHIKHAYPNVNQFGGYSVSLEFNAEGAQLFYEATKSNVNRRLAVVLDGTVYSAPNINEAISGGRAEISGNFTAEEANKLGVVLRCGNLPVPIRIEGEFSTDPTLGKDSVASGRGSAIAGMILVIAFMWLYYRLPGLIADIALYANVLLIMGTMTIAGATITLPGIAGIALTIGMAVDANVLIYERMREELANKKSVATAVHAGYSRAFLTILDSNLTTLLTALILYRFGSGSVRGFAVTLSIGIIASMFTSLFMTRAIFDLLVNTNRIPQIAMRNWFQLQNIDFLALRRLALGASLALMICSVAVILVRGASVLSVDFRGGTEITFNYAEPAPSAQIRELLEKNGYLEVRVAYKAAAQKDIRLVEIICGPIGDKNTDIRTDVISLLNGEFPASQFSKGTVKTIGGLVGTQFTKQSLWALFWAVVGILVYVTFRFEFAYGLGAIVALIHDVVIAVGLYLLIPSSLTPFSFADRQISMPTIAAILTVLGYSINDKIVVFDRVRENLGLLKKMKFEEIVNLSINHTLSRTMLTGVTTLMVITVLFFFGGGEIADLALLMFLGIVIGTYSSILIATPIVVYWHDRNQQESTVAPAGALRQSNV